MAEPRAKNYRSINEWTARLALLRVTPYKFLNNSFQIKIQTMRQVKQMQILEKNFVELYRRTSSDTSSHEVGM